MFIFSLVINQVTSYINNGLVFGRRNLATHCPLVQVSSWPICGYLSGLSVLMRGVVDGGNYQLT